MRVLVLGSGVLGITTAYVLASRGHAVEVIERKSFCAAETSFANGGQLSYSHAEPWATPQVLAKLPRWIFREDSPLIFRFRLDPAMIRWGLEFLRNCTSARARENCVNILRLGLYSRKKLEAIRRETNIPFDYSNKGILHIFSAQKDFDHAIRQAEFQAKFGCEETVLNAAECLALEPSLGFTKRKIVGGIHAPQDESGDAQLFCAELADICEQKLGVRMHYNTAVERIVGEEGNIVSVVTNKGEFKADAYVVALGSYSPLYLNPLGISVPIYPMKGYSLTIPADEHCPTVSVTDGSYKIVYSRLDDRLRVAGTAEFAGYDSSIRESRIAPIIRAAKGLFPGAAWDDEVRMSKWACLRPSTPDGPPILGFTPYRNLFLNTGHGTLGWTQAAGSAYIVADLMENRPPEIMLSGLTLR